MFVANYLENNVQMNKLLKESGTFAAGYNFWIENLFERAMRLFVWENTGDVPAKEIEIPLLMKGHCGVTKFKGAPTPFYGEFGGAPTQYFDEYKQYNVYSPVYTKMLTVGTNVAIINNNALRNSLYPLVHRYAIMLAHTETTFVDTLINGRDAGGTPIASTEAQKQAITNYRNALCNGKVTPILDPAFSGVEFISSNKNTVISISDLLEARTKLLQAFYNDIGVKTSFEKKGNMIAEEVEANSSMLLLNLSDMLDSRKKGAEAVNAMFGTNWTVRLAEGLEVQFGGDEEKEERDDVVEE